MVVLVVVAILFGVVSPAMRNARDKAHRISCVSHLKNIGLGFRIFATDNNDLFPWQSTNSVGEIKVDDTKDPLHHFLQLTNELSTPVILHCPADTRLQAETWKGLTLENVSYFISQSGAETYPQSFLAGDRNLMTNGVRLKTGIYRLPPEAKVGWDNTIHKQQGNACMGDGSVQQLSGARLRESFKNTGMTNEMILSVP